MIYPASVFRAQELVGGLGIRRQSKVISRRSGP